MSRPLYRPEGNEQMPLLSSQQPSSASNTASSSPRRKSEGATGHTVYSTNGGHLSKQQKTKPLDSKLIAKQSRPRKAIAEFRKKGRRPTWHGRIGVHVPVDEINIELLTQGLQSDLKGWTLVDHFDVVRLLQIEPPFVGHELWNDWPLSDEETSDRGGMDMSAAMPEVYIFSFGAVVFWNFPNAEYEETWLEETILQQYGDCYGVAHSAEEIESAADAMAFEYGNETSKYTIKRDVCTLCTHDAGEKLAVSFALAKSSLLSIYEWRVQRTIERNSHIPEEMAKNGRIKMTRQEISKEVGRIFLVKHGINLDQSLVDTPEEFWEDDRFEPTYESTLKYFEVSKRLTLVNNRLSMISELHTVLIEENASHHAVVLEWIIIWLIVIEVMLDMLHLTIF